MFEVCSSTSCTRGMFLVLATSASSADLNEISDPHAFEPSWPLSTKMKCVWPELIPTPGIISRESKSKGTREHRGLQAALAHLQTCTACSCMVWPSARRSARSSPRACSRRPTGGCQRLAMHAGSDALRRPPDASCKRERDVVRGGTCSVGTSGILQMCMCGIWRVVAAHTPESLPDVMIHALAA